MSAPNGIWSNNGAPGDEMHHVIDSAIFELSFDNRSSHWPDAVGLAGIVASDLMQVVNEVFDERSRTSGAAHFDRLEVDLGPLAFDGSWTNLRERIREGLRAALARTKKLSIERPGAESRLSPAGFLPSTGLDLLEHFLRFGVLPQRTQSQDRRSMDVLLRDMARVEPQRLAALIRDDAVGGVVTTRLVRQFPAALIRQIAKALGPGDARFMLKMISQVNGQAADFRDVELFIEDLAEDADLSPVQNGDGPAVRVGALEWRQAIAAHTKRVDDERFFYRQVRERLVSAEPIDVEANTTRNLAAYGRKKYVQDTKAPMRPLSGSERLFRGYDLYAALIDPDVVTAGVQVPSAGVIDELAREHPQQFRRLLLELRRGVLRIQQIAGQLSGVELRGLLQAFIMPAAGSADADRRRFLHSIDDHAGRARNERVFHLQVLQRLIDGELVDLEAIAADTVFPAGQNVHGRDAYYEHGGRNNPPDAGAQASGSEPEDAESGGVKQVLRDYLGNGVVPPGRGLEVLRRAAGRSLELEPQWFTELLWNSLKGEKAIARLVGLLPERLLTRALYLLTPATHERMQRYADAIANACNAAQTGITAARVTELKWQCCFQHLLEAGSQWKADLFVQRFADLLAAHTPAGAPASNAARFLASESQRFAGFLRQSLKGDKEIVQLAGSDRRGAGDLNFEDYEDPVSSGATGRVIEPETTGEERRANDVSEIRELFESGIRIANAGQILAAPYLPRLFGSLDLVEDGVFKSSEAQARAVHLLQYMVDGTSDTPEYGLVLNKILCGLDSVGSVNRGILIADAEREAIEGLLRGMVHNWQALGSTSVDGFRESFLQREGRLRLDSDGWHLAVDPEAFDMLLDRIPWSFSIVKHSWMNEVVYVDWR